MKAFLVEGHMEKRIVERLSPGVPVRLIGANGDHVAIKVLAKFIAAQLDPLLDRYHPIHVVFDRERRAETCEQIEAELRNILSQQHIDTSQVTFSVADRTTESWFLPFLREDGTLSPEGPVRDSCEGIDAKGGVKGVFKNLRKPYLETVDGVRLFCSLNPRLASELSPSFRNLITNMGAECWWTAQLEI